MFNAFYFCLDTKESSDLFLIWIPLDHWKIISPTNIFILKVWACCIFKDRENGNSNDPIIKKKKYWKALLHFLNVAISTMTLQSLRVRLIKLHSSCNAMWGMHCFGSRQSIPISCSTPALDKWQPTTSLQSLAPSGLLINVRTNQPLSEKDCKAECTCCTLQWWVPERCLSVRSLQMLFNFMLELYPKMEMRWQSSTNLQPPSLQLQIENRTCSWGLCCKALLN